MVVLRPQACFLSVFRYFCLSSLLSLVTSVFRHFFHLTELQAYIEGTLDEWTVAALAMIRRTLQTVAVAVVDGDADGDGGGRRKHRGNRVRRSLASALASKDCSPTNGRRLTRISATTGMVGESNEAMHLGHPRSQSMLRRLLSLGRGQGSRIGQGGDEGEDGDKERVQGDRGGAAAAADGGVVVGNGDDDHDGEEEGRGGPGARALSASAAVGGDNLNASPEGVASSSRSPSPSPAPVWRRLVQQQQQQQEQQQEHQEGGAPGLAQAEFEELLRDAQAETGSGIGVGVGVGTATGRGRDVMGALLETSEELVKAVEMQQKVSNAPCRDTVHDITMFAGRLRHTMGLPMR